MSPTSNKSLLQRLDDWCGLHKGHACSIEHDDGYGASSWIVSLTGHGKIDAVPGSRTDLDYCKKRALENDIGKWPHETVIAGYTTYDIGNEYTYVLSKDGGEATLEDLLCVALTYMEELYERSKGQ